MAHDGGPAFPSVGEGFGNPRYAASGMSLRDWFAGMALQGVGRHVLADLKFDELGVLEISKVVALFAYAVANAMLAEREKECAQ